MRPIAFASMCSAFCLLAVVVGAGSSLSGPASSQAPARTRSVAGYSFDLVRMYPRPTDAFTQGLAFEGGKLYEGTGLYGESSLREMTLEGGTLKTVRQRLLPTDLAMAPGQRSYQAGRLSDYGYSQAEIKERQRGTTIFGEGITLKGGKIYQLTWTEGLCLVWNQADWTRPVRVFTYKGEGWGLTHDGTQLIMSDGSATLQFRNPDTFEVARTVVVTDPRAGAPVTGLNELEFVNGQVFANVYGTRQIAIIEPKSGVVEGYVLLGGQPGGGAQWPSLMPRAAWDALDARWDVLNGIAHDAARSRLFVTGKRWPFIYEIRLRKVTDRLR